MSFELTEGLRHDEAREKFGGMRVVNGVRGENFYQSWYVRRVYT